MPRDFRCLACGQLTFATDAVCDRCGIPIRKTRRDDQTAYSPWRGRWLSLLASIVILLAALFVGTLGGFAGSFGFWTFFAASLVASWLWSRTLPPAELLHAHGRSLRGRSAEQVLSRDHRRKIVYLRGFTSDTPPDDLIASTEEQVARRVRTVGPPVALGRPGEEYPPRGFSRAYMADEQWKSLVSHWLSDAQLVLISAGFCGDSLGWEITQCQKLVDPRRVLLLVESDATYYLFRHQFDHLFPRPLPAAAEIAQLSETQRDLFEILPMWLRQRLTPDTPERVVRFRHWGFARVVQVDRYRGFFAHASVLSRWKARRRFDNILRASGLKVPASKFWTWLALIIFVVQVVRFVWLLTR